MLFAEGLSPQVKRQGQRRPRRAPLLLVAPDSCLFLFPVLM